MNLGSRIFVAGHRGLVGSAIVRKLEADGYQNLILRSRDKLPLDQAGAVEEFFKAEQPEYVFLAAAKVGGIHANSTYPADFIRENLAIQLNVIDAAHRHGTEKLLFLGSSCIYPKFCPQPMKEEYLLTGELEPTNEPYALAKIAGLKMCEAYRKQHGFNAISLMPTNLYGPGDNFDLQNSHVIPALIRKFHEAKERGEATVTVWGSGTPKREFLYVDDLADAAVFLTNTYEGAEPLNVGTGEDVTIREAAEAVQKVVGFTGQLEFDASKPDGTPRKLLDVSRVNQAGWKAQTSFADGLRMTYEWYLRERAPETAR